MTFDVAATAYDRFMGRWSGPLADLVVARLDPAPGTRALDVGCGPGALTRRLADRLGAAAVTAADPVPAFADAVRARLPGVDVRVAAAERLPFDTDAFDLVVAQLVVQFMTDPAAGLAEMRRVCRPGGTVATCVWDHGSGRGPLSPLWEAVREQDPAHAGETDRVGARAGQLEDLARAAGLGALDAALLSVPLRFATFEEWWEPFTLGVGPAGEYVASLDDPAALVERLRSRLGPGPFELSASAWYVAGRA